MTLVNLKKDIIKFLEKKTNKDKVLIILGPTASGKTSFSLELAKIFQGEIINTDIKQVYQETKNSTGVITKEEQEGIIHHLFSFLPITKSYNLAQAKIDILQKIKDVSKRKKLPILVGGTALIIDSLINNYQIPENSFNPQLREQLEKKDKNKIWQELKKIDYNYSLKSHLNNKRRNIRALEVFYTSKQKMSEIKKATPLFDYHLILTLPKDREELYQKINLRMKQLWQTAIKKESKKLFEKNLDLKLPGMQSLGIKEAFSYFKGEITEDEAIKLLQKNTRNYAKRQITWCKRYLKN
jgi:tRNA dimethylallyltransferase